jgi:large subunit ribosomal protein L1
MAKHGKRYRALLEKYDPSAEYPPDEACRIIAEKLSSAKFNETVLASFKLGIDPKKSDQSVRGTVVLPNGTGKQVRVLVLTKEPELEAEAKEAGADMVGFADYIEKIKGGWLDFDVVVASPEAMPEVGKLGKILGARGLMPSPKAGTVTKEVGITVRELKAGRVEFKADKGANIHVPIGKTSFGADKLLENFMALAEELIKARPQAVKGTYIKSAYLSPAMGPSVRVSLAHLAEALRKRGVKI